MNDSIMGDCKLKRANGVNVSNNKWTDNLSLAVRLFCCYQNDSFLSEIVIYSIDIIYQFIYTIFTEHQFCQCPDIFIFFIICSA